MSKIAYMVDSSMWVNPRGGRRYHLNHEGFPVCGTKAVLDENSGVDWDGVDEVLKCKRCVAAEKKRPELGR